MYSSLLDAGFCNSYDTAHLQELSLTLCSNCHTDSNANTLTNTGYFMYGPAESPCNDVYAEPFTTEANERSEANPYETPLSVHTTK